MYVCGAVVLWDRVLWGCKRAEVLGWAVGGMDLQPDPHTAMYQPRAGPHVWGCALIPPMWGCESAEVWWYWDWLHEGCMAIQGDFLYECIMKCGAATVGMQGC